MKKPNILFALADDASHMGAYGHKFVRTPNFDRIAKEGILFNNAFTTNPKCAPSRASILTGMHTWQLEDACNHFGKFSAKFNVYPELLEKAGYLSGYTGKGWCPGDWESGGFKHNPAGEIYNSRKLTPPEEACISTNDYAGNFEDFLAARKPDQPFCFWYGGWEPHRPYNQGEGERAGKSIKDIEFIPSYWPDDDIVKNDMLDYAYEIEWFDKHLGKMLKKLEEIGELDNTLIIVTSDNGMPFPRIKGQMYEQDFHLPMALCWRDKINGNRTVDDLISFADLAPTILQAAGLDIDKQMTGESFFDIMTSDKSGVIDKSKEHIYMGKERHDLGREDDLGYPVRCIRSHKYLYVRNFKPDRWPAGNPETGYMNVDNSPTKTLILDQHNQGNDQCFDFCFGKRRGEELYDIVNDPECINNLSEDPGFAEIKTELWNELEKFLIKTNDPRMFGKGDVFDEYIYVGEDQAHSWDTYVKKKNNENI